MLSILLSSPGHAVSARYDFLTAYAASKGGDWYLGETNEDALLAWGESYVMMGLAAMVEETGDRELMRELARHVDAVLETRDDARGVSDYRGTSDACWQNTSYQKEPYCYVVHSGMIGYPIAEAARLVALHNLGDVRAHDGEPLGEKADAWTTAAAEIVAAHDDQWVDGTYIFPGDATFLSYAGQPMPLNQANAMGRLLLVMHDLTGSSHYLDKATALAQRFHDQITVSMDGALEWEYWGGALSGDGEDISHAAINVDFAIESARRGVVFDDADLRGFATTFMKRVYVDDQTIASFVTGGASNDSRYMYQAARWLGLSETRTSVYAAVHDFYADRLSPDGIGSASLLYGFALLGVHQPVRCTPDFYYVDWSDEDKKDPESWREATAYGANILTTPPDMSQGCAISLEVDVPRDTIVQQWDGAAYHDVVRWAAQSGTRLVPFEPRWPYPYYNGGVLFQFSDDFVDGDGIRVKGQPGALLPEITSTPDGEIDEIAVFAYTPQTNVSGQQWWSFAGPPEAELDRATGQLTWYPTGPITAGFTLRVETENGAAEQSFTVDVLAMPDDKDSGDTGPADTGADSGDGPDPEPETGSPTSDTDAGTTDASGCGGCGGQASVGVWVLLALAGWRRRED